MATTATAEDLEMIEAVVDALDSALTQIDATEVAGLAMAPVSQLACIGVAVVRAVVPMLRSERDRMRAEVVAGGNDD